LVEVAGILLAGVTDEQKEIFEKFHAAKSETIEYRFGRVNPQKQGVGRAEQAQATDNDYATVARSSDEYVSLAEAAIFEYAFRLGARLTIEVQTDTNE